MSIMSDSETDDEHVRGRDDNCGGMMEGEQEAQDDNEDSTSDQVR